MAKCVWIFVEFSCIVLVLPAGGDLWIEALPEMTISSLCILPRVWFSISVGGVSVSEKLARGIKCARTATAWHVFNFMLQACFMVDRLMCVCILSVVARVWTFHYSLKHCKSSFAQTKKHSSGNSSASREGYIATNDFEWRIAENGGRELETVEQFINKKYFGCVWAKMSSA